MNRNVLIHQNPFAFKKKYFQTIQKNNDSFGRDIFFLAKGRRRRRGGVKEVCYVLQQIFFGEKRWIEICRR